MSVTNSVDIFSWYTKVRSDASWFESKSVLEPRAIHPQYKSGELDNHGSTKCILPCASN
jgi:hypothetical protein